jgi:uncharacterized protein YndB with AHSA1/START domain
MVDVIREIEAIQRTVDPGPAAAGEGHTVRLARTYDAPIDEAWNALTTPDRITRWFLPISGDYRVGGHFQFEGNAGGKIVSCDPPNRLRLTWGMNPADPASDSDLEIRLTAKDADTTLLELLHTAVVPEEMWDTFGPGAVGVGWEGGFLGLALHLQGGEIEDKNAWMVSDEARGFYKRSSEAWGEASRAGGVDDETVARNIAQTTAFYTGSAPDGQ